jgi:hypothetical protein
MTSDSTTRSKIYDGPIFDETNYHEWKDAVFESIGWHNLSRIAIPLVEGELAVRKEKPTGDGKKVEDWEDMAERAMIVIQVSLGARRWIIKEAETPSAAFLHMHKLYSGATKGDKVKLENQWVNAKPKGDRFMEYIAEMSLIMNKLNGIGITRTDTDLCLRLMASLSQYPADHPFGKTWDWLDNQFREDPDKVNLQYFKENILAATEKLNNTTTEDTNHDNRSSSDHALLAVTKLAERLERVYLMASKGGQGKGKPRADTPFGPNYTGCNFCKSLQHKYANCDHPEFDPDRHRQKDKKMVTGSKFGNKKRQDGGNTAKRFERSNVVEDRGSHSESEEDDDDVSGRYRSGMKMKKACECYNQIGSPPSPGIDPGAASKGGSHVSFTPPVRRPHQKHETKKMDVADGCADNVFNSESISESLYKATSGHDSHSTMDTILDSGCTKTMFQDRRMFDQSRNYRDCSVEVRVGDGFAIEAKGVGDVCVIATDGTKVRIPNCLWVPDLKINLVSVSHLDNEGFRAVFENGEARILEGSRVLLSGYRKDNLYHLDTVPMQYESANLVTSELLHQRLGHYAARKLRRLGGVVDGLSEKEILDIPKQMHCDACARAKSIRSSFPPSESRASSTLELLHMDLAGPSEVESIGGKRYMLIIVDDFTRYYHTILLHKKSDAYMKAVEWISQQERRLDAKVKRIRTDGGGEFIGADWKEFYSTKGIQHEKTVAYSPEQNGRAERAVGIVKNGARTYMMQSRLPMTFWGAAVCNFTYTRNMLPTVTSPTISPHESFFGTKPDVGHLRSFGCVAYVHIPKERRKGAWSPRARKVIFIGYAQSEGTKAWIFYDPERRENLVSVHAKFWESIRWSESQGSSSDMVLWQNDISDTIVNTEPSVGVISKTADQVVAPRTSERHRARPLRYGNYAYHASDMINSIASILSLPEHQPRLRTILEMAFLASSEKNHRETRFLGAKKKELASMYENDVWELVQLPPGERAIPCRWLCTDKLMADLSTIEKARLIVMGHLQKAGRDFQEIFAPVLKMESVQVLLALIAMHDMDFIQGDVKTAFLYGPLEETVYMRQPPGFEEKGKEDWVCRLKKAIYGLHQAPRAFYRHISNVLLKAGYRSIHGDPSIFTKVDGDNRSFIGLYVDDAILASTCPKILAETKAFLMANFRMTWTEQPKMLLGIQIYRDREAGTLRINQRHYAQDILRTFDMDKCTPKKYPMLKPLPAHQGGTKPEPDRRFPFLEFIGKLNYLARSTRPDLSFVASHLATFCSSYQQEHWDACLNVMRYIQGTLETSIVYSKHSSSKPVGYSDADYATNPGDRKSISGYGFMYAGGMISWRSKKQPVVAHSSSESELIALDSAAREGIWITSLFNQLSRPLQGPMTIWEDNQGTINITKNPINHVGTKHIDVRYFAIRDWVAEGKFKIDYLPTRDMLADALTKPLNGAHLRRLCEGMGMEFEEFSEVSRSRTSVTATKGSVME